MPPPNVPDLFPHAALERSVVDRFREIASLYPNRVAVSDRCRTLTYSQLSDLVDGIASVLATDLAGRPGPIAILVGHEARFIAAMLASLASGRSYLPLDADHPIARNKLIATHAEVAAVLSTGGLAAAARAWFPADVPIIDLEQAPVAHARAALPVPGPDDIAHIIYTSGSTGMPKGVVHSHRNCLHDVQVFTNAIGVTPEDRLTAIWSPSVIAGIRNAYSAVLNGASLHILSVRELQLRGLIEEIQACEATIFQSVPQLFRRLVAALRKDERFASVRRVRLSGDRVEWSDMDLFRRAFPTDALLSVWMGSTECSSQFAHWFVDEDARRGSPRLPVGRLLPDVAVAIVDDDGRPVAEGGVGEFVVSSRYLALGYWNAPELTRRAFATDPEDPESRTFATGDLGFQRPDGLFEFIGRKDNQIKIRGHRIEIEEIETALRQLPRVRDAGVLALGGEKGGAVAAIGYVELLGGTQGMLPRHLLAMLSTRLPEYMVPAAIRIVGELPRLANGKLDRVGLADLEARRVALAEGAQDPLVKDVIAIFETVLGRTGATPEDNLSTLGGDSLQLVDLTMEIERQCGLRIEAETFKATETIRDLAKWIESQRAATAP